MNDRILKTHRILLMMLGTYVIKILVSFSMQKMDVDLKMLFIMLTFILFLNCSTLTPKSLTPLSFIFVEMEGVEPSSYIRTSY